MIDIHSHILPEVDDGSRSIAETITMISEAYKNGITDIIATSHYMEGNYEVNKSKREEMVNILKKILTIKELPVKIYIGAEVYISSNLIKNIKDNEIPTLNNSKYLLFELPMNTPYLGLYNDINHLKDLKIVPILAHPERYPYIRNDINKLYELIDMGVLLQCNVGSFIGKYGKDAKKFVAKMSKENLINFIASDTHRANSIYEDLGSIQRKVIKIIGKDNWEKWSNINPKCILENKEITK